MLIYGLSYEETAHCIGVSKKTVRNIVSGLYGRLEIAELQELLRLAHANGFDFDGRVYGEDVLQKYHRTQICNRKATIVTEKQLPQLIFLARF